MPGVVYEIPFAVEACLGRILQTVPEVTLARATGDLSAFFTSQRVARPRDYFATPDQRAAYLAYFLPANYSKLHAIFDEMNSLLIPQLREAAGGGNDPRRQFRLLDLGAGPGTMTLAALEYLHAASPESTLRFFALDSNQEMLKTCRQLFHCVREQFGIKEQQARLETLAAPLPDTLLHSSRSSELGGPFHLIVLGNVWNELVDAGQLSPAEQIRMTQALLSRLHPEGALVLIEPALRETSRALHFLHDVILEQIPGANVFAPCVHQCACPCVAPGKEKDWCHIEFEWKPTDRIRAIDRRIGNRKDALKFSYLVLRKDGKNVLDLKRASAAPGGVYSCWRVVSELMVEKGKRRAFLCGTAGRFPFTRLDRHETSDNEAFGNLVRGDIVKITGAGPVREDWRVTETASVQKL